MVFTLRINANLVVRAENSRTRNEKHTDYKIVLKQRKKKIPQGNNKKTTRTKCVSIYNYPINTKIDSIKQWPGVILYALLSEADFELTSQHACQAAQPRSCKKKQTWNLLHDRDRDGDARRGCRGGTDQLHSPRNHWRKRRPYERSMQTFAKGPSENVPFVLKRWKSVRESSV